MRINISISDEMALRYKALAWYEGKTFSGLLNDLLLREIYSRSDSLEFFDDFVLKRYKNEVLDAK